MHVLFVEHSNMDVNFDDDRSDIGGIPARLFRDTLKGVGDRAFKTCEATLVIAHVDEIELGELESAWKECDTDLIIVRVSKGGQNEQETRPHAIQEVNDGGISRRLYELNVRKQRLLESGKQDVDAGRYIAAVYSTTVDDARAIACEKIEDTANPLLRELFTRYTEASTLVALSILCQGYLIVHAKQGAGDDVPEWLKRASEQLPVLTPLVTKVQEPDFWNVFEGKSAKELGDLADTEWKGLAGDGDFDTVTKLISALTSGKPVMDVKMVVEAYKAIQTKLGAGLGN